MSLEELREQNIRLVTEKALECFIKNGINNTRVSEIAAESGLTQRSVFRYFPSKDDIVIAAAFCYWERAKAHIARAVLATIIGVIMLGSTPAVKPRWSPSRAMIEMDHAELMKMPRLSMSFIIW